MSDDLVKRLRKIGDRVAIPCPDNIKGCAVFHFRIETDPTCKEAADRIEELEAKLDNIEGELLRRVKHAEDCKKAAGSGTSQRREHYRMHALSEALGAVRKIVKGDKE